MDRGPINEATIDQLDDVYEIIRLCALDLKKNGQDHWVGYYDSPDKLISKFEKGKVFILYIDSKPVATVSVSEVHPSYYTDNEDGPGGTKVNYINVFNEPDSFKVLYRSALAVLPEYQRQGLGEKLIQMTEVYARNEGYRYLRFDTRNEHLLGFYERNGYQVKGEMPDGEVIYYLVEKDLSEM